MSYLLRWLAALLLAVVLFGLPATDAIAQELPTIELPPVPGSANANCGSMEDGGAWCDEAETTVEHFLNWSGNNCLSCGIVSTFMVLGDAYAKHTYSLLAPSVRTFLTIMFALYILFQFLKVSMPFGEAESAQPFRNIMLASLFFVFANAMLSETGKDAYWTWVYETIIVDSSKMGGDLLRLTMSTCNDPNIQLKPANWSYSSPIPDSAAASLDTGGIPAMQKSTVDTVMCQLINIQNVSATGMAIGMKIMGNTSIWSPGAALSAILHGFILVAAFTWAMITVGYYMVDIFIKMAVISALMPILIIGMVIPLFRNWLFTAIKSLVSSGLSMIMACIIYGIAGSILCFVPRMFIPDGTAMDWMVAEFEKNDPMTVMDAEYWVLLLSACFMIGTMRRASSLSDRIVGSDMSNPSTAGSFMGKLAGMGGILGARVVAGSAGATVGGAAGAMGASKLVSQFSTKGGSRSGD